MRLSKKVGLVALAAMAVTALMGASSASATSTALCKVHEEPCAAGNQVKTLHMVTTAGTVWTLLNSIANVLCLSVLWVSAVGNLASPQSLTTSELAFKNCGTSAAHNNCTVTADRLPNFTVLKTALNLGLLTNLNGLTHVHCAILGFLKIDCIYDNSGLAMSIEGALHNGASTGHGMVTLNNAPFSLTAVAGLCPASSSVDGLFEPLEHVFIVG